MAPMRFSGPLFFITAAIAALLLAAAGKTLFGQSSGGFLSGQVLTAAELNAAFQAKSDYPYIGAIGMPGVTISGTPTSGWVPLATSSTTAAWGPLPSSSAGMVGDGTTDNAVAFQSLLTAAGNSGGSVTLPCGNFVIAGSTTLTVASGKSVTIVGQGQCTILSYRGTNATVIDLGDVFASISWGHMRVTTNGAGLYTGLAANMNGNPVPILSVQHTFNDIIFTGSDYMAAQVNYWTVGLQLTGLSHVHIDDITIIGVPSSRLGTGVLIKAINPAYAVGFVLRNLFAIYLNTGIDWETNTQGINILNSTFQSNVYGIKTAGAGMGLSELAISNSQFGDNNVAGVSIAANVGELAISNSLFEMGPGPGGTQQVGIEGTGFDFNIVGNSFLAQNAASMVGVGIALTSAQGFGTITSNTFTNLLYGITADAGSTYATVHIVGNNRDGSTNMYNFSGGTNIYIDDKQPVTFMNVPMCTTTIRGSMFTITDLNATVAFHGTVLGNGSGLSRIFCYPAAGGWVQN
jgi:hypothetical protein